MEAAGVEGLVGKIDVIFSSFNRSDMPGMVVGVARQGRILYRRGFGLASLEHGVINTPATRLRIGSTSKHFTALLALLLAEEGKLDLDASIRTYVPELAGPGGDPSLRQLLQHRGGSRCYLDLGFMFHGLAVPQQGTVLATQIRQVGRNFAPGDAMIYNNSGYHLVSIAIERVGGATFESQLKSRLFDPLGMADTASVPSDYVIVPGIATMHMPAEDGGWRRGLLPSEEVRGEGAIISTVDDMLRWAAHLRSREEFGSTKTWHELTDCQSFPDGTTGTYALGLMVETYRGVRVVHHAGGVIGGSSQMLTVPDHGLDIVILVNGAPGADPVKLANQVLDVVLDGQLDAPESKVQSEAYRSLVGDWWSAGEEMVYSLTDEDGLLKLTVCGTPMGLELERKADGRVVSPGGSLGEIEVGLDQACTGDGLRIKFGGRSATYQKVSKDAVNVAAFAKAAVGEYRCEDGHGKAVITTENGRLLVRFEDAWGAVETDLDCLGESVAISTQRSTKWSYALSFSKIDGRMNGFGANSMRTRGLAFERI